jgi:hypothetical protein
MVGEPLGKENRMRSRPPAITVAAILMALFSLMNFPGPWWYAVPGAEETPAFIIYSGIVLGMWASLLPSDCGC